MFPVKEKRYRDDWAAEVSLDERSGKDRLTPIYRGTWYFLPVASRKSALRQTGLCFLAFLAGWVLFLLLDFPGTRVLYVFLPLALAVFPLVYWGMGLYTLARLPGKMTRLQKEKSLGRILHSSAGAGILAGTSFLGEMIFHLETQTPRSGFPGSFLLLLCVFAASLSAYYIRKMTPQVQES